jgi:tetratricopeptide (TPR) repeat protein
MGMKAEAEETFQRALRYRRGDFAIYNDFAVFYYRQGRYDDAIEQIQKALSLNPEYILGYNNLGAFLFSQDRMQEAIEAFQRSLSIQPNHKAHMQLGTVLFYEGQYEDAAEMYQKALEWTDTDYRIWGFVADSYYWAPYGLEKAHEYYEQAALLAEKLIETKPNDPLILSDLAAYYVRMGNHAKAQQLLNRVEAFEPSNLEVILRMAEVYENMGYRETALKWMEAVIAQDYPLPEVQRNPGLRDLFTDERFQSLIKGNTESVNLDQ